MLFPSQPGYRDTSGGGFDRVDIGAAKAALEADGWRLDGSTYAKDGQHLTFRLLHSDSRSAEAQLTEATCQPAGITIVDDDDPKWSNRLGNGQFDAALFTLVSTPTLSSHKSLYHSPPSPQDLLSNYGDYSNPQVDRLMDQLATNTDPAALTTLANEADALLWTDLATIPLWQLGLTWNLQSWSRA